MNKKLIIEAICEELGRELNTFVEAALDAREAATNEEAKAENKYDTRGLEASYLAGAQAKRAKELADYLAHYKKMDIVSFDESSSVHIGALVDAEIDGEDLKSFFIVPFEGGMKLQVQDKTILTLSPESPLGKKLMGQKLKGIFEFATKSEVREYEIVQIY